MKLFSIATLSLVFLLLIAASFGGAWIALVLIYSSVFAYVMDRVIVAREDCPNSNSEFPTSDTLSISLGWLHFALLAILVWRVAGVNDFSGLDRFGLFLSFGLFFGQVSHPNAHDLIHHKTRNYRRLGRQIYSSLLVGHHTSAHRLVHHVHVGTKHDPNSARIGHGFYRYALKAWIGAFRGALRAETKRMISADKYLWEHPFIEYAAIALATLIIAFSLAGLGGIAVLGCVAIYTQIQMLLSDYIQHYGLRRALLAYGRYETVGLQHSWNSPHAFSSALMLNAPRHSDHHINPSRPYSALRLDPNTMPILPYSLPVMAMIALWPPLWRRLMDPLCAQWRSASAPKQCRVSKSVLSGILPTGLRPRCGAGLRRSDLPKSAYEISPPTTSLTYSSIASRRKPNDGRRGI